MSKQNKVETVTNHSFKAGNKTFMLAGEATLPIREYGSAPFPGWDIPVLWAFDAAGQAWEDNAHGGYLHPVSIESLKGTLKENPEAWRRVASHLDDKALLDLFKSQLYYLDHGDAGEDPRFGSFVDVVALLPEKQRTIETRREVALMLPGDYLVFPTHTVFRVGRRVNLR